MSYTARSRMSLPPGIKPVSKFIPQFQSARGVGYIPTSLGYTVTVNTPWGKENFSIPAEQIARDVAQMAMDAAWPIAMSKLQAELPNLMNMAFNELQPYMRKEIDRTMNVAESKIDDTMDKAIKIGAIGMGIAIVAGTGLVVMNKIKKKRG